MFGSSRFPEAHPPCPGLRRWSPAGGFQGGAKVPPTYRSQGRGRPRRRPAGVPDPNSSCGGPPGSAGARIPSSQGPGVPGFMRHAHGSGTPSGPAASGMLFMEIAPRVHRHSHRQPQPASLAVAESRCQGRKGRDGPAPSAAEQSMSHGRGGTRCRASAAPTVWQVVLPAYARNRSSPCEYILQWQRKPYGAGRCQTSRLSTWAVVLVRRPRLAPLAQNIRSVHAFAVSFKSVHIEKKTKIGLRHQSPRCSTINHVPILTSRKTLLSFDCPFHTK